jgi:adenine/guanine/hypoxanthine permease
MLRPYIDAPFARTGLGNVLIAVLLVGAMFCAPLVAAVPGYSTAAAWILLGALMSGCIARVKWDDFTQAFPAFMTVVATPLTFSIASGLSLGLLSFTFLKIASGRAKEISPLIWILSVLFLCHCAFLASQ